MLLQWLLMVAAVVRVAAAAMTNAIAATVIDMIAVAVTESMQWRQ